MVTPLWRTDADSCFRLVDQLTGSAEQLNCGKTAKWEAMHCTVEFVTTVTCEQTMVVNLINCGVCVRARLCVGNGGGVKT